LQAWFLDSTGRYGWNFLLEVKPPPVLARLFSQRSAASINLAERFLKFVQRIIEPTPPIIQGLHLLAKLDPFLHLNVVLLDAILYLTFKICDLSLKLCDQYVVGRHLLVEVSDALGASL